MNLTIKNILIYEANKKAWARNQPEEKIDKKMGSMRQN